MTIDTRFALVSTTYVSLYSIQDWDLQGEPELTSSHTIHPSPPPPPPKPPPSTPPPSVPPVTLESVNELIDGLLAGDPEEFEASYTIHRESPSPSPSPNPSHKA